MSLVVVEFYASPSFEIRDGLPSATRTIKVYDTEETITEHTAYTGCGVAEGDEHPRIPGMVAQDASIQADSENETVWIVTWYYRGNSGLLQSFTDSSNRPWINGWRSVGSTTLPTDVDNPSSTTDIAGTPVDAKGEPVSISYAVSQMQATVTYDDDPRAIFRPIINRRNNEDFLGVERGKLLYTGYNARAVGSSALEVTHTFVADENYHLRQMVERDEAGKPKLGGADDGDYTQKGYPVFWVQPYKETAAFTLLEIPGTYEQPPPPGTATNPKGYGGLGLPSLPGS